MNTDENEKDEIHLSNIFRHFKPFMRFVLKKWLLFLFAAVLGIGLGIVYFMLQKPNYKAACTFVLEEKQAGLGGLGGIASQFGFDIGSLSGGGSIYSGENIYEILKSQRIINKVLLSRIDSARPDSRTLADLYIEYSGLKKKWQNKPLLSSVSFANVQPNLSLMQDTALNIIYEKLTNKSLSVDKAGNKGNLIKVQVEAENRTFAILLAQRIVEAAKDLYIYIKVGTAQGNINKLQRKADSLQILLNGKSYVAANTQIVDANPGLTSIRVPGEIASRDKTVIATLYSEVVKNLEASKLILAQQTPVIQVIDYPNPSTEDNLISKTMLIIIGIVTMLFLFFSAIAARYIINVNTNK